MGDKTIWDMDLFERHIINGTSNLTRVPGGWIYDAGTRYGLSTTFIPYSDDLNPNKPAKADRPPLDELYKSMLLGIENHKNMA